MKLRSARCTAERPCSPMSSPAIWESAEWAALTAHAAALQGVHLRELLADASRSAACTAEVDGVLLDYSRQRVTAETLRLLLALAERAGLRGKLAAMAAGARVNGTEGRAALHTALRAPAGAPPLLVDGVDVHAEVHAVLARVAAFADAVRAGAPGACGATGQPLTAVVAIGIGGR